MGTEVNPTDLRKNNSRGADHSEIRAAKKCADSVQIPSPRFDFYESLSLETAVGLFAWNAAVPGRAALVQIPLHAGGVVFGIRHNSLAPLLFTQFKRLP